MDPAEKPLRILALVNIPWDLRLGAARVWIELAEHWRAAGHTVESYSFSDAYPRPSRSGALFALRQVWFSRRAAHFIRRNRNRYDVIDALLGSVAQSKDRLRFRGLLVARSVGFYWLYQKFDLEARERWPDQPRGKLIGRILYTTTRKCLLSAANQAVRLADLINLPNDDELTSLRGDLRSDKAAIVQPYALTAARRSALHDAAATTDERLAGRRICFIGMWSIRKGARDWVSIFSRIRSAVSDANFRFLGTRTDDANVRRDLRIDACDRCEIIPEYEPGELPQLLRNCTVGVFPSYVEGFGFAVLEQLAAGIPTVAYDVPGPRHLLRELPFNSLVRAGDSAALADRAIAILRMQPEQYSELREQSFAAAAKYSWPEIAAETIRSYREALKRQARPVTLR